MVSDDPGRGGRACGFRGKDTQTGYFTFYIKVKLLNR